MIGEYLLQVSHARLKEGTFKDASKDIFSITLVFESILHVYPRAPLIGRFVEFTYSKVPSKGTLFIGVPDHDALG